MILGRSLRGTNIRELSRMIKGPKVESLAHMPSSDLAGCVLGRDDGCVPDRIAR